MGLTCANSRLSGERAEGRQSVPTTGRFRNRCSGEVFMLTECDV